MLGEAEANINSANILQKLLQTISREEHTRAKRGSAKRHAMDCWELFVPSFSSGLVWSVFRLVNKNSTLLVSDTLSVNQGSEILTFLLHCMGVFEGF